MDVGRGEGPGREGSGPFRVAQFANLRYHTGLIHFIHYLMEISVFMVSEGYV